MSARRRRGDFRFAGWEALDYKCRFVAGVSIVSVKMEQDVGARYVAPNHIHLFGARCIQPWFEDSTTIGDRGMSRLCQFPSPTLFSFALPLLC